MHAALRASVDPAAELLKVDFAAAPYARNPRPTGATGGVLRSRCLARC